jgi:hypothetical protein
MRTNSIFIAHVAEAIGSPLGRGRGRRSGLPRGHPHGPVRDTDQARPRQLAQANRTYPSRGAGVTLADTRLRQVTWPAVAEHRDYIVEQVKARRSGSHDQPTTNCA